MFPLSYSCNSSWNCRSAHCGEVVQLPAIVESLILSRASLSSVDSTAIAAFSVVQVFGRAPPSFSQGALCTFGVLLAFALFGCQYSVYQCLISASSDRYSSHEFWRSSMVLTDRGNLFRVTVLAPFYSHSSTQSCHVSFHPDCEIRSLLQSGATL